MVSTMTEQDWHVVPVDDLIEHDASPDCICGPEAEPARREDGSIGYVYTHHSLDGREAEERRAAT